jgi:hypothetical protein
MTNRELDRLTPRRRGTVAAAPAFAAARAFALLEGYWAMNSAVAMH